MAQREQPAEIFLSLAAVPGTYEHIVAQIIRQQERERAAKIVRGWRENGLTEDIGVDGFCRPSAAKIASAILDTPATVK